MATSGLRAGEDSQAAFHADNRLEYNEAVHSERIQRTNARRVRRRSLLYAWRSELLQLKSLWRECYRSMLGRRD